MALGVNANYEAFVNWASSRTADTIADAASGLDGKMAVSDKVGDGIGFVAWIKRSGIQKDANNATRELFFGAVRDMFGGEAFIPESVKKAMHFSLFKSEGGKPLSARRITEVKVAIEQWKSNIDNGTWDLNGTKFEFNSDRAEVIKTFDSIVGNKKPNVSKVLSMLLSQLSFKDSESITQKIDRTKGSELFVSRDVLRDGAGITNSKGFSLHYGLEMSEDGNTATVTIAIDKDISSNGSSFNEFKIGKTTLAQKITVDLTKDIPEVTDVQFAQTIAPDKIDIAPGMVKAPPDYFS